MSKIVHATQKFVNEQRLAFEETADIGTLTNDSSIGCEVLFEGVSLTAGDTLFYEITNGDDTLSGSFVLEVCEEMPISFCSPYYYRWTGDNWLTIGHGSGVNGGDWTIHIYSKAIKQLDEKFIPDTIARTNYIISPDDNGKHININDLADGEYILQGKFYYDTPSYMPSGEKLILNPSPVIVRSDGAIRKLIYVGISGISVYTFNPENIVFDFKSISYDAMTAQPDWNQNDETQPDYIKNRICSAKVVTNEYCRNVEVPSELYGYIEFSDNRSVPVPIGKVGHFEITVDGKTETVSTVISTVSIGQMYHEFTALGHKFGYCPDGNFIRIYSIDNIPATLNFSWEDSYVTIEDKYIPDTVARRTEMEALKTSIATSNYATQDYVNNGFLASKKYTLIESGTVMTNTGPNTIGEDDGCIYPEGTPMKMVMTSPEGVVNSVEFNLPPANAEEFYDVAIIGNEIWRFLGINNDGSTTASDYFYVVCETDDYEWQVDYEVSIYTVETAKVPEENIPDTIARKSDTEVEEWELLGTNADDIETQISDGGGYVIFSESIQVGDVIRITAESYQDFAGADFDETITFAGDGHTVYGSNGSDGLANIEANRLSGYVCTIFTVYKQIKVPIKDKLAEFPTKDETIPIIPAGADLATLEDNFFAVRQGEYLINGHTVHISGNYFCLKKSGLQIIMMDGFERNTYDISTGEVTQGWWADFITSENFASQMQITGFDGYFPMRSTSGKSFLVQLKDDGTLTTTALE